MIFQKGFACYLFIFFWVSRRWINIMEATINNWGPICLENAQIFIVRPLQYQYKNNKFSER